MNHQVIEFSEREVSREQWRDIPGHRGRYQASTLGRIRSVFGEDYQRVLNPSGSNPKVGYRVSLYVNGDRRDMLVARLVAETWVGTPFMGDTVNHINGNRFDNRVENLEWLSLAENIRHGFISGLYSCQEPVVLQGEDGQLMHFRSKSEASRFMGKNVGYVSKQLARGRKTMSGYRVYA